MVRMVLLIDIDSRTQSRKSGRGFLIALIGLGLALAGSTSASPAFPQSPQTPADPPAISQADPELAWRLIDKLGSPVFAEREAARRKLLKLKNEAYDVLLEARQHENAEVRLAVRALLDAVEISWVHAEDPPAVANLLKGYGEKSANERKSIVAQLARIDEGWDCWVLVRIVRFDGSEAISKWAALALMQDCGARAIDPLWQSELVRQVHGSRRTASRWLRQFPEVMTDPLTACEPFERFVQAEFELAARRAGEPGVDPSLSLALSRWYIELKLSHLPDASVEPLIEQMAWLIAPQEPAAKEHLDWLAMVRQWPAVIHWSQAQGDRLEKWPEVQFRVAEAYRQLGQHEAARRRGVLGLEALPTGLEDGETIAHGLYAMNYPVWGIEVLRHTLEQTDPGTETDWRVRIDAALWLEDQCRWGEAAEVLRAGIEFADSRSDGWNSIPDVQSAPPCAVKGYVWQRWPSTNSNPPRSPAIGSCWTKHSN